MRNKHPRKRRGGHHAARNSGEAHAFRQLFTARFDRKKLRNIWLTHRVARRKPLLPFDLLLLGLVYHVLIGVGTLQEHIHELTGKSLTAAALSQRRKRLSWAIFEEVMALVLQRRADPKDHPHAFWRGLRLMTLDGTRASLRNTPAILSGFKKAISRRMKAAFAQVQAVVLLETGLHNPVAAAIGCKGESELVLALRLVAQLVAGDLLLADRLYGVQKVVAQLLARTREVGAHFLVRVRRNLKAHVQQVLHDGSALVELTWRDETGFKHTLLVREMTAVVRGRDGKRTKVRLWTSLLDAKLYPAGELVALYAQRWEVEITIKELKVEMRGGDLLASYTPETAAQEIAALLLALAVLVEVRCEAAQRGKVEVLRVSFRRVLRLVRALWTLLEIGEGIHTPSQVEALVARTMERATALVTPVRRARSCPRAVRQPVGSWPRLLWRREWKGKIRCEIIRIRHSRSKS